MKTKEMLETIKYVERNFHGITKIHKSRVSYFQLQNLPLMKGVEYDSYFNDFIKEIEAVMGGTVREITAKKILNNWYLWAEKNLKSLRSIKKFGYSADPIEFLIKNDFRIDHTKFAKLAKDYPQLIEVVKEKMPKGSLLFQKSKNVADTAFPSPRGFSYDYLVKVIAGFSSTWGQD
ncbi:hypothetical protein [Bacillus cereus]|uniref:hypothetical protein n=1 Tax=Bacillus cereus TaxID=1396 RepID=UPI001F436237|nr:hypothetical protein [Bacillus cereus]MCE7038615.1 hypothetical protein [Bacillus cereus]MCM3330340.1 hypothetical protein [Bacillus cereus]